MVLHRTLAGKLEANGNDIDLLFAKLRELPPSPSALVPGIRPDVDALVMRAIQIDPAKRFETMDEFRAAIESA
jgi:hypothetical protein